MDLNDLMGEAWRATDNALCATQLALSEADQGVIADNIKAALERVRDAARAEERGRTTEHLNTIAAGMRLAGLSNTADVLARFIPDPAPEPAASASPDKPLEPGWLMENLNDPKFRAAYLKEIDGETAYELGLARSFFQYEKGLSEGVAQGLEIAAAWHDGEVRLWEEKAEESDMPAIRARCAAHARAQAAYAEAIRSLPGVKR